MSDAEAELTLLSCVIRRRLGIKGSISWSIFWGYTNPIYPTASYILKNVAELRLDDWKMTSPSASADERHAESRDAKLDRTISTPALRENFHQVDHYLRKIMERVISTGMDEHTSTLFLLETLGRKYYVDNILILILTSFALGHGAGLLVLKSIFADSIEQEDINMVLKRVVSLTSNLRGNPKTDAADWETGFCIYISLLSSTVRRPSDGWISMESLYNLIRAMLDVTKVFRFLVIDLRSKNILRSLRDEFDDLLCLSLYWIVHGVVACSSQCNALPKKGYVIQDSQKLIYVYEKLTSVHRRLQEFKKKVEQFEDDEKIKRAYEIQNKQGRNSYYAFMALFGQPQLDRSEGSDELKLCRCDRNDMLSSLNAILVARIILLQTFIFLANYQQDLSISTTLKGKILLLLISGLDISSNEILFLRDTYIESKTSVQQDYEVVWVPVLSGQWTTSSEEKYTKLLRMMSWHMVEHPKIFSEKTKKFIRQVWKFKRRPIVVVIDKNGDVVFPNVIHMIYIWGFKAFPFTPLRERTLWNSAEARLDSLVFDFDPNLSRMLEDGKWVILYGGNDVEWSRKLTTQMRKLLSDACILVEMIYVGENRELEPQSYSLDLRKVFYFWTRLESILISRYQSFSAGDSGTDPILGEVKKLLSYKSAETWACLKTPSSDSMVHGLGDVMLQGFMKSEMQERYVQTNEFAKEFQNHIEQLTRGSSSGPACHRIVLHTDDRDAVESLKCPSCDHSMEKKIRYGCCHIDEIE
uniref:Sieve element occlusion C-terminal domain-containing protein n=1 Tax=Kalanchoe fedtschenkoi TaxID=63787 RepID=A0A7N0T1L1_KALFE